MATSRIRPTELANQFPTTKATVTAWRNGNPPSDPVRLTRLASLLRVSLNWLTTGQDEEGGPGRDARRLDAGLRGPGKLRTRLEATGLRVAEQGIPAYNASQSTVDETEGESFLWGDPEEAEGQARTMLANIERTIRTSNTGISPRELAELQWTVVDMLISQTRRSGRSTPIWLLELSHEIMARRR